MHPVAPAWTTSAIFIVPRRVPMELTTHVMSVSSKLARGGEGWGPTNALSALGTVRAARQLEVRERPLATRVGKARTSSTSCLCSSVLQLVVEYSLKMSWRNCCT